MPYQEYPCPICEGYKMIDIGQEINEEKLPAVECPCCEGKGYLHVEYHINTWNAKAWKRMMGEL